MKTSKLLKEAKAKAKELEKYLISKLSGFDVFDIDGEIWVTINNMAEKLKAINAWNDAQKELNIENGEWRFEGNPLEGHVVLFADNLTESTHKHKIIKEDVDVQRCANLISDISGLKCHIKDGDIYVRVFNDEDHDAFAKAWGSNEIRDEFDGVWAFDGDSDTGAGYVVVVLDDVYTESLVYDRIPKSLWNEMSYRDFVRKIRSQVDAGRVNFEKDDDTQTAKATMLDVINNKTELLGVYDFEAGKGAIETSGIEIAESSSTSISESSGNSMVYGSMAKLSSSDYKRLKRTVKDLLGAKATKEIRTGIFYVTKKDGTEVDAYSHEDLKHLGDPGLADIVDLKVGLEIPESGHVDLYCYSDQELEGNIIITFKGGHPTSAEEDLKTYPISENIRVAEATEVKVDGWKIRDESFVGGGSDPTAILKWFITKDMVTYTLDAMWDTWKVGRKGKGYPTETFNSKKEASQYLQSLGAPSVREIDDAIEKFNQFEDPMGGPGQYESTAPTGKALLKSMLVNMINDRVDEAKVDLHAYLVSKMIEVSSTKSSEVTEEIDKSISEIIMKCVSKTLDVNHSRLVETDVYDNHVSWVVEYEFPEHGRGIGAELRKIISPIGKISFTLNKDAFHKDEFVYEAFVTLTNELTDKDAKQLQTKISNERK